jgi:hypothetical protein
MRWRCSGFLSIFSSAGYLLQSLQERALYIVGELLRFFHFLVARDFLDHILQIVQAALRKSIFARRDIESILRRGKIQVVGLDSARIRIVTRVRVNRNEQVRFHLIRNRRALFERDERVISARVDHFSPRQTFLN